MKMALAEKEAERPSLFSFLAFIGLHSSFPFSRRLLLILLYMHISLQQRLVSFVEWRVEEL